MIPEKHCVRCGKVCFPTELWKYKIGGDYFCGYTCHLHEVSEREEAKRKREEEAQERKRLYQKKRNFDKYRYRKNDMRPYIGKKKRILQCDSCGNVIAIYQTSKEAAEAAKVSPCTMSLWLNGKRKIRNSEFLWKYEGEG